MRTLKVIGIGREYGLREVEDWGGVSHVLQKGEAFVYGDESGTLCVLDRNYISFQGISPVPKAVRFYDREDEWKEGLAPNPANKRAWEKTWKYKHLAFFGMTLPEAMETLKARAFQVEGKSGLWVL